MELSYKDKKVTFEPEHGTICGNMLHFEDYILKVTFEPEKAGNVAICSMFRNI